MRFFHFLPFKLTLIALSVYFTQQSMAIYLRFLYMFFLAISFTCSLAQSSENVDPSKVIQISWQPRVFLYRGFVSEEECDYLISQVHGKKSDTLQSNGLSKAQMNDGLSLGTNNEIATRIEEKISAWTFLPKENSESMRALHFGPEDPKKNYNYFDKKSIEQVGGQPLLATVILYLSNVTQGGQILFPESENKMWSDCAKSSKILRPTRGNAVLFFNLHINATPDSTSVHARCPVLEGEMWYATKFFYLKRVKFEKEVEQSNDADCTDEDDNCPRWAAVGECQRNSVFMIGSPDYYGTCRKSCNVC